MLKTSTITTTYQCNSCGAESTTSDGSNPYYRIDIVYRSFINSPLCEIDLCSTCISQITTQTVIDWISNNG